MYDATPRALSNSVGAVVVSAHYRQGPEHKFPAAHEDAFAAYKWTVENAIKIRGDPSRIAVSGESAGGNLANAVSMAARDQKFPLPVQQLLVYPVAGADMNTPSYQENANAKPLNIPMMKWFFDHASNSADANDPRLVQLKAELTGLPSTAIVTAQIDPLRSDGEMLAQKLQGAGLRVSLRNFSGVTHEFFGMGAIVPAAKGALAFASTELKSAFAEMAIPALTRDK